MLIYETDSFVEDTIKYHLRQRIEELTSRWGNVGNVGDVLNILDPCGHGYYVKREGKYRIFVSDRQVDSYRVLCLLLIVERKDEGVYFSYLKGSKSYVDSALGGLIDREDLVKLVEEHSSEDEDGGGREPLPEKYIPWTAPPTSWQPRGGEKQLRLYSLADPLIIAKKRGVYPDISKAELEEGYFRENFQLNQRLTVQEVARIEKDRERLFKMRIRVLKETLRSLKLLLIADHPNRTTAARQPPPETRMS